VVVGRVDNRETVFLAGDAEFIAREDAGPARAKLVFADLINFCLVPEVLFSQVANERRCRCESLFTAASDLLGLFGH